MPRPESIDVIDLMVMLPTSRNSATLSRSSDGPLSYLFKGSDDEPEAVLDAEKVIELMDKHGIAIAQIPVDVDEPEAAINLFKKYPSRFIGDVSVDPNVGMDAVRALEATVKLHPNIKSCTAAAAFVTPQVPLDDKKWYPIYAKCCELGIPLNVYVGVPGPRVPFAVQHPGLLDEIAWFFPELQIVMRHGGEPWTELCCKLMLKWPNLYYCTSAFAPKYYPRDVLEFADSRGREKVMFTGYFPMLSYDRIFKELDDLPLREETWLPFLQGNAARVYELENLLV